MFHAKKATAVMTTQYIKGTKLISQNDSRIASPNVIGKPKSAQFEGKRSIEMARIQSTTMVRVNGNIINSSSLYNRRSEHQSDGHF